MPLAVVVLPRIFRVKGRLKISYHCGVAPADCSDMYLGKPSAKNSVIGSCGCPLGAIRAAPTRVAQLTMGRTVGRHNAGEPPKRVAHLCNVFVGLTPNSKGMSTRKPRTGFWVTVPVMDWRRLSEILPDVTRLRRVKRCPPDLEETINGALRAHSWYNPS